MAMVCPKCATSHEQRFECPECGARLVSHDIRATRFLPVWTRNKWMHTTVGRICVGVLLAQGLFYALRHLYTGITLMIEGEDGSSPLLSSFAGLMLLQGLQVLAPAMGGVLAGSSRRGGWMLGAFVGAVNGALSLVLMPVPGQSNTPVALYGLPLLQTIFGALGGWVGATIWKPLQPLTFLRVEKKTGIAPRPGVPIFSGSVAWTRVFLGTGAAIAGTMFAGRIFDWVLRAGDIPISQVMQDQIVTWEIKSFAILFGAALAGANTFNGLKQGLCVGFFSSCILIITANSRATTAALALTTASSMLLSLAGGWFGCQLLPPVVKQQRRELSASF
jgi:hypothetical protein